MKINIKSVYFTFESINSMQMFYIIINLNQIINKLNDLITKIKNQIQIKELNDCFDYFAFGLKKWNNR